MKWARWGLAAVLACAMLGAAGRALADANDAPVASPKVLVAHGVTTIVLDARARANGGIVCAPVAAGGSGGTAAMGAIVPVANLAPVAAGLAGDTARRDAARAAAAADAAALRRARELYADGHNASAASVQAAVRAAAASAAALAEASASLAAARASARQVGPALARAMATDGPTWRGLMDGRLLLARLDVPASVAEAPPARLSARLADGRAVPMSLLGATGVASVTLGGPSFYYLAAARPGVLPGMALTANWPAGGAGGTVVLPQASVVWLQGRAFVYARAGEGRFVRVGVMPEGAGPEDAYVARGVGAGTEIVVVGAQMLLSEEFRAVATAGGDQD